MSPAIEPPHRGPLPLVGDGFTLRPWRATDAASLVQHADDPRVARFTSDRFPHPYRPEDADAFLSVRLAAAAEANLAIVVDGEAVGGIAMNAGDGERRLGAELGYWLGHAHWGRGIARRAVGLFVPWGAERLGLCRVEATVLEDNPASMKVLLANGFVPEGIRRLAVAKLGRQFDLHLFSKVRDALDAPWR